MQLVRLVTRGAKGGSGNESRFSFEHCNRSRKSGFWLNHELRTKFFKAITDRDYIFVTLIRPVTDYGLVFDPNNGPQYLKTSLPPK